MKLPLLCLAASAVLTLATPIKDTSGTSLKDPYDTHVYAVSDESTVRRHSTVQPVRDVEGRAEDEYRQNLTVTIGNVKQNIGDHKGPYIYGQVWDRLNQLCPDYHTGCKTGNGNKLTIDTKYLDKNNLEKTGKLSVWAENASFTTEDALRRLLIGTIAGTVQSTQQQPNNCYRNWQGFGPHVIYCNIPGFIGAELRGRADRLDVHFEFATSRGHFDCVGTISAASTKLDELLPEFEYEVGSPVDKDVWCPDKDVT